MVMKERDEELALFLEMRRREKEKEKNNNLLSLHNSEQLNAPLGKNVTDFRFFFFFLRFFLVAS